MIDTLFARFEGAYSKNTIRAYRADFSDDAQWCHTKGTTPVPASGQHHRCMRADIPEPPVSNTRFTHDPLKPST